MLLRTDFFFLFRSCCRRQPKTNFHEGKKWKQIAVHMLPTKSEMQLKNRFKNLISRNAEANPLKSWWEQQNQPITEQELQLLQQVRLFFFRLGPSSYGKISDALLIYLECCFGN